MSNRVHDLHKDKNGSFAHDWRPDALRMTLQFVKPEEKGEKINPREYTCRVWVLGSKDYGYSSRGYCMIRGSYDECFKAYKENFNRYYMELQCQIAKEGYGIDTYLDNKDDYYRWTYEQHSKRLEKADESRNWRAGDAPWNAPGMSVRDFI